MPIPEYLTLNTGAKMPILGLGTWKSPPGAVEQAVEFALRDGYKHIDTAAAYSNEAEVGIGIKASGVKREDFFLTTKLQETDFADPEAALESSLNKLGTDYLDLWLMHWPAPMTKDGQADKSIDWVDTWKEMERLYQKYPQKLKAIGVSNVSVKYFERLYASGVTVTPAVNQVELHPSCPQQDVVDYCVAKGIVVTAYSPLGSDNSPLLTHDVVKRIADKYGVGAGTVLISLPVNRKGVNVIPKSVTKSRIAENKKLIELTEDEVKELNDIDKTHHFRACHPNWTGWGSLGFPDCAEEGSKFI